MAHRGKTATTLDKGKVPIISADGANMDLEPELEINWYLLWLILGTVVLTKLLRAGNPKICKTVSSIYLSQKGWLDTKVLLYCTHY